MSVGKNIKDRRMKKNITQQVFAEQVGIGQSMLAQIERGSKLPNIILAAAIAKALDCTMEELIEE